MSVLPRALLLVLLGTAALPASLSAQVAHARPAASPSWHRVDALADTTPPAAAASVASLAAYLSQAGPDELSRARALYRWVTGNIDYDGEAFRTGSFGNMSPEAVLRSRSAVCQGYASLTQALGAAMGLEVQVVTGWSKGYGYQAGQRLEGRTNHAWNAVRIAGQWRLMDPTWGAGYLDERMRFVRRFEDHYFLTPPDAFVFDHLPEDPRWQLMERPIGSAEYLELVYLRPMFFVAGFRVGSHPRAVIDAADRVRVTLNVTRPVRMSAQVLDASANRVLDRSLAFVQTNERLAEVHAVFPRPGAYVLRLFALPRDSGGSLEWVLDYRVQVSGMAPDGAFPTLYQGFGATGAWLFQPLTGTLQAGRNYPFRLRAPGAIEVVAVMNTQWTHFTRSGDEFVATVPVTTAGSLTVYAKYDPASQHTGLVGYTVR